MAQTTLDRPIVLGTAMMAEHAGQLNILGPVCGSTSKSCPQAHFILLGFILLPLRSCVLSFDEHFAPYFAGGKTNILGKVSKLKLVKPELCP